VKDKNVKIFIAELIGTMVLVLGGCGTAVLATGDFTTTAGKVSPSVGTLGIALAFGLSLLVMAYAIGPISGCHINPAVTLGLVIAKKAKASIIPLYWSAQIVGGVIGAVAIKIIVAGNKDWKISDHGFATNGYGKLSPGGFNMGTVIFAEILFTTILVLVIIHAARKDFAVGFAGITVGLTLALIHIISIPIDNTSVNPARSLGVALMKGGDPLSQVWVFIVFPLVGAIVAALIALYLLPEDKKAAVATS
jgi:aquaporin Z